MPRVTIRKKTKLMQEVQEKTSDILEQNDRVLVVYQDGGAAIYYEQDTLKPRSTQSPR